jgi:hypothetical protein
LCAFVFYFSDLFFDCPCPTSAHACSILPSYHSGCPCLSGVRFE